MKYTQPKDINQNPLGYQLSTVNVLDDDMIPLNSRIYSIEILIKDVLDYINEILEELASSGNVMDFYTRMTHRIEDMLNTIAEIQVALSSLKTSGAIITNRVDNYSNVNQLDPILNSCYTTLSSLKSTLASEAAKVKSYVDELGSNSSSVYHSATEFNKFYREVAGYMTIETDEAVSEIDAYHGTWTMDVDDIRIETSNKLQQVLIDSINNLDDSYNTLTTKIGDQANLGKMYAAQINDQVHDKYLWLLNRTNALEDGVDKWLSTKKPVLFPSSSDSFRTIGMKTLEIS